MKVDTRFLARYWGLAGMRGGKAVLGGEIIDRMAQFGHYEPLENLINEGLIYEPDIPENRRRKRPERKYFALTEKGRKWLEENVEKYNKGLIEFSKSEALKILDRFKGFAWRNIDKFLREWEIEQALTGSMGEYLLLFLKKGDKRTVLLLKNIDSFNYMIQTFDLDVTEEVRKWSQGEV
ncbi:hypothetical protein [Pyrococcus kukulkanii]|uniref:hypothetical protein n=1 Tax=Pyrococcus kukulkanii TaxID=1609559 RepID=UPI003563B9CB